MNTDDHRRRIASEAAEAIERAPAGSVRALVGFDGFIDLITRVVDRRRGMGPLEFEPVRSMRGFAERIASASGRSANLELIVTEERWGGNGPLMAGALASVGADTTYIGAIGAADDSPEVHPLFAPFAARCRRVIPIAAPATTDCLEFDDGKVMFNRPANVQHVTWERIKERVGRDELVRLVNDASIIGIVNWTLLGGVPGIWCGLCDEVFPVLSPSPNRRVFIDLTDPAKRTDDDIRSALRHLADINRHAPLTLGLNQSEAERLARVSGVGAFEGAGDRPSPDVYEAAARALRERLGLSCVVIHPREGAAAATDTDSAWFDGPFTARPAISTGAGDHFNGGFAYARALGLSIAHCLAAACAASGAYVRDAVSPTRERLVSFLRDLPAPHRA